MLALVDAIDWFALESVFEADDVWSQKKLEDARVEVVDLIAEGEVDVQVAPSSRSERHLRVQRAFPNYCMKRKEQPAQKRELTISGKHK